MNIFFIGIGCISFIPAISPVRVAIPTVFFVIAIIMICSMIKDGLEDIKRHVNDMKENEKET
jgi:hypothetical protein